MTLDGVIEAEYGDWTGGAIAELARTDLWRVVQTAPSRARFPNGEGIAEMQARMVAALDELINRLPLRGLKGPVGTGQDGISSLGSVKDLSKMEEAIAAEFEIVREQLHHMLPC